MLGKLFVSLVNMWTRARTSTSPPPPAMSAGEAVGKLARSLSIPRHLVGDPSNATYASIGSRDRPSPRPAVTAGKRKWRWDRHTVQANTKSEARAMLKKIEGLERLPIGANVVELVKVHEVA